MTVFTYRVDSHGTTGRRCLLSLLEDGEVVTGGVFERPTEKEAREAAFAYGERWATDTEIQELRLRGEPVYWFDVTPRSGDAENGWNLDLHSDGVKEDGRAFEAGKEGYAAAVKEGQSWLGSR